MARPRPLVGLGVGEGQRERLRLLRRRGREAILWRRRNLGHFVAAGIAENGSVFLTVVALGLGTVSDVTPLTATAPIFVLLLTLAFLRGIERLSARIVPGTALIVFGVYLITALAGR